MLCEIASQVVTTKDYLVTPAFTGSSREEDIGEMLDSRFFIMTRQELHREPFSFQRPPELFEIDLSSVYSQTESKIETYITKLQSEEDIISGILKQDFIVRMPPIKQYRVCVNVKSVEKATPRIVELDEI